MNRKKFLQTGGMALGAVSLPVGLLSSNDKNGFKDSLSKTQDLNLDVIGKITLKKPSEIDSSPFGLGCETLDRKLWDPKEVYPWLTDLPVKWARLQTGWARVEQERGKYNWEWLDESIDGLLERGIQPFLNIGYGNPIYTEGGARYHPMVSSEALQAFKHFVSALANRYQHKIKHYEIWNEPNIGGFWHPDEPNAEKYTELVREVALLVRKNCSDAIIVGGVTSRIPYKYIRQALEAGLAEHIDIFSFHPYGTIPERYIQLIESLRNLLDEYKPGIEIWQGENGFPSDPGSTGFSGQGPYTENIQAKIMLRRLLTDCALNVKKSVQFLVIDLHDYPKGSGNVNYKGILRAQPEIKPKVAFRALQNLGSVFFGEVEPRNSVVHILEGGAPFDEEAESSYYDGAWENIPGVFRKVFNTEKGPVLTYWSTKKAKDKVEPFPVHLFFNDWEGDGFKDPVLVDILKGDIMQLPSIENSIGFARNEAQLFQGIPVFDYPLFIMERDEVI